MLNRVWVDALTFGAHESDREGLQYIIGLRRIVALLQETGTLIRYPEALFEPFHKSGTEFSVRGSAVARNPHLLAPPGI